MTNLNGTSVNLNERRERGLKHEKTNKCFHKPFNTIRNVEKLLLIRDKLRSYNPNNKGNL
jgi:hypothetical protein